MIALSKLKNEKSCICAEHNRLPNVLSTMRYNSNEDKFIKIITKVENNEVTIDGINYSFPDGSEYHQIAFDTLGEYVRTWMLNGKGYIDYMDNLTNKRVTKEVECTSISCGISTVYTYSDRLTEVLVAYTKGKEVSILEQSGRFQTPKLYATLSNDKARIRVCGVTNSNRFLIRFFNKISVSTDDPENYDINLFTPSKYNQNTKEWVSTNGTVLLADTDIPVSNGRVQFNGQSGFISKDISYLNGAKSLWICADILVDRIHASYDIPIAIGNKVINRVFIEQGMYPNKVYAGSRNNSNMLQELEIPYSGFIGKRIMYLCHVNYVTGILTELCMNELGDITRESKYYTSIQDRADGAIIDSTSGLAVGRRNDVQFPFYGSFGNIAVGKDQELTDDFIKYIAQVFT